MNVHLAQADTGLDEIADVMLELRPTYVKAGLIAQMREQMRSGYQVAYVEANDHVLCVAGFVFTLKLASGKQMYVDDLVTAERHRSTGAGAMMIAWLKDYARQHGCKQLHLDSGVHRFRAHRFYFREGFFLTSHHFAITELAR